MAQLTEHFEDHELGVEGCDQRHLDNATLLCEQVLEPIRAKFGPVHVRDGYRDPGHNAAVGGKTASFHLFTDGHAAADIDALPAVTIPALFDWLRLESGLPFDKVILETNAKDVPACVHIQIDRLNPPRRQAFIGHTGEDQVSPSCPEPKRLARARGKNDALSEAFSEPDGFHSRGRRVGRLLSVLPGLEALNTRCGASLRPAPSHKPRRHPGRPDSGYLFGTPAARFPGYDFCHRFSPQRAGGMHFPNVVLQECTQIHRYAPSFFPL